MIMPSSARKHPVSLKKTIKLLRPIRYFGQNSYMPQRKSVASGHHRNLQRNETDFFEACNYYIYEIKQSIHLFSEITV